ncbi:MAG: acyltransferase, partial [Hyphomicrobium sp.]|nr:acyltransferase [Hyphomicrobium sp.]
MSKAHALSIPSLDGIRAISVLIVVLSHSGFEIVPGGLGVTIFFFLSGYLITTLMLAESESTGEIDILKFYARRVFRLMPPLLIRRLGLVWVLLAGPALAGSGLTAVSLDRPADWVSVHPFAKAPSYVAFGPKSEGFADGCGDVGACKLE